MSGVGDYGRKPEDLPTPEMVKEVMRKYNVDEKTARLIINDRVVYALERMKKWTFNMKKRQKEKADYIYRLFKSVKKGRFDKLTIDEIEKKILELCVEG